MTHSPARNETFLRNIYSKGPFQGHGFICSPPLIPIHEHPDYDYTLSAKPVANWVPWVVENYRRECEWAAKTGDDAVPCARLTTGTHLYAAAFGCPVHRFADSNACAAPLAQSAAEADRLAEPDVWKSPGLARVFELAEAVRRELGQDVFLGPPDMQSGFDTASLVWNKADFLCAMMDDDDSAAVERLVGKGARLFKSFLSEFRKAFPRASPCHCPSAWAPPEMGPWLSNDECGAFSTGLFERFCLPELMDLSRAFGGLGMHCCASAEHQFPAFNRIPGFYAFNRVQARQGYGPILEHFSGPAAPVHVLAWLDDAVIENLIRTAAPGTRFIFVKTAETPEAGVEWLARMRSVTPG